MIYFFDAAVPLLFAFSPVLEGLLDSEISCGAGGIWFAVDSDKVVAATMLLDEKESILESLENWNTEV